MEQAQAQATAQDVTRLNPYYNGRYSWSLQL